MSKMMFQLFSLWQLFQGALVAEAAAYSHDRALNQIRVVSNLRGNLHDPSDVTVKNSDKPNSILSRQMYHGTGEDNSGQEFAYSAVTIPISVHLSNTPRILANASVLEQVIVQFISDNINDSSLSKHGVISVLSATIIEQRWTQDEDSKSIGLELVLDVRTLVPNTIQYNKLQNSVQKLFNFYSDVFQVYLQEASASQGDMANNSRAASVVKIAWWATPQISIASIAAGCCGMTASIGYLLWKVVKTSQLEESVEVEASKSTPNAEEIDSKPTAETFESNVNDSYLENNSVTFPIRYHEKKPEEWDDISASRSDDLTTDDGSFSASVKFCPSVLEKRLSFHNADIEDNSYSKNTSQDDDSNTSSIRSFHRTSLSPESLQEFDLELRQAEF